MSVAILTGDCRTILPTLPAASVQCVVTSPPYWGLRDYGVEGQLGLEFRREFSALADEWRRGAGHYSLEVDQAMHPAYQAIIAMGPRVIPCVLDDLQRTHDLWFWALRFLNRRVDVAADAGTHDDKVRAWLAWGVERGYIRNA